MFYYLIYIVPKKIDIVRLRWISEKNVSKSSFNGIIEILDSSEYKKRCPQELAPEFVDCISSIRYLVRKTMDMDFSYWTILELPYLIDKKLEWDIIRQIDYCKLEIWDLLFLVWKKKNVKRFPISHMWIYLWDWELYHYSYLMSPWIFNFEELFDFYNLSEL